jgi:hypothetical protein
VKARHLWLRRLVTVTALTACLCIAVVLWVGKPWNSACIVAPGLTTGGVENATMASVDD